MDPNLAAQVLGGWPAECAPRAPWGRLPSSASCAALADEGCISAPPPPGGSLLMPPSGLRRASASYGSLAPTKWASIQEFHDFAASRLASLSISTGRRSLDDADVPRIARGGTGCCQPAATGPNLNTGASAGAPAVGCAAAELPALACSEAGLSPDGAPTPLSWRSSQESCAVWSTTEAPAPLPWSTASNKRPLGAAPEACDKRIRWT
mmetsp:Transcript_7147/g.18469  ORF Transcript_7147/g.18469 Transcript_7147/m.18469 type:complete len:208 (+) Transcript_7147:462-1085(+)